MKILADDTLMVVKIYKKGGDYFVSVKVHNGIVNEWNMGSDELVAKKKSATIVNTYLQALDEVQKSVVSAYEQREDEIK